MLDVGSISISTIITSLSTIPHYLPIPIMSRFSSSSNSSRNSNNNGWSHVGEARKMKRTVTYLPRSMAGYVVSRLKTFRQDMNETFGRGSYRFEWRTQDSILILHGTQSQQEHMLWLLEECFRQFNRRRSHRAETFEILDDIPQMDVVKETVTKSKSSSNRFDIFTTLQSAEDKAREEKKKQKRLEKEKAKRLQNLADSIRLNMKVGSFNWADC